jgi:TIR domain
MSLFSLNRTKIFISYSHKDAKHLDRLLVHLAEFERQGIVDPWSDKKITPGASWRDEIRLAIETAKVAVLLISADFLASPFIAEDELPLLLAVAQTKGTVIIPT